MTTLLATAARIAELLNITPDSITPEDIDLVVSLADTSARKGWDFSPVIAARVVEVAHDACSNGYNYSEIKGYFGC